MRLTLRVSHPRKDPRRCRRDRGLPVDGAGGPNRQQSACLVHRSQASTCMHTFLKTRLASSAGGSTCCRLGAGTCTSSGLVPGYEISAVAVGAGSAPGKDVPAGVAPAGSVPVRHWRQGTSWLVDVTKSDGRTDAALTLHRSRRSCDSASDLGDPLHALNGLHDIPCIDDGSDVGAYVRAIRAISALRRTYALQSELDTPHRCTAVLIISASSAVLTVLPRGAAR